MSQRACLCACCLAVALASGCGCEDKRSSSPRPDAAVYLDAAADANLPDASPPLDASPPDASYLDQGVWPDGTVYDFCGEPFFKLPIDGSGEIVNGIDISEGRVAYTKYPSQSTGIYEVYLFDIPTCTERRVTTSARADRPSIWQDRIAWTDARWGMPELVMFDLWAWQEIRLTNDSVYDWSPLINSRYVLYSKNTDTTVPGVSRLLLWDLVGGTEVVLAEPENNVSYTALSEGYAAWLGVSGEPGSVGRDVHVYDIDAGETIIVPMSKTHHTYSLLASGRWVTYISTEVYDTPPWKLHLYDIQNDLHVVLAEDDYAGPTGMIHENLVAWATSLYVGGTDGSPADINMYDARLGIYRRLTSTEGYLRPAYMHFPYLLVFDYLEQPNPNMNDWYVVNLVELGVTDEWANLKPGDGVLDQPPR